MTISALDARAPWDLGDDPWPGWHLVGRYDSDVGAWLLHHGAEACLLEVPEGLTVGDVRRGLKELGVSLKYVAVSHQHEDHLDADCLGLIRGAFPHADCLFDLGRLKRREVTVDLAGEPLHLIGAPKHSWTDQVVVFRGVAMTGDLELGTLESSWGEVPRMVRAGSMDWFAGFEARNGYKVHTAVSAHLDDVRAVGDWAGLFRYQG